MNKKIYTIEWHRQAAKTFEKISDQKLKEYILHVLKNVLAHDPMAGKSLEGSFKGTRSYRMGVIRIIYKIYKDRLVLIVLNITHRRDVYRR